MFALVGLHSNQLKTHMWTEGSRRQDWTEGFLVNIKLGFTLRTIEILT